MHGSSFFYHVPISDLCFQIMNTQQNHVGSAPDLTGRVLLRMSHKPINQFVSDVYVQSWINNKIIDRSAPVETSWLLLWTSHKPKVSTCWYKRVIPLIWMSHKPNWLFYVYLYYRAPSELDSQYATRDPTWYVVSIWTDCSIDKSKMQIIKLTSP